MKVIDLLNKIANEEEVPERIKFLHNEFYYDEDNLKYKNMLKDRDDLFEHIDFYKGIVLNDEVEIIEDTPKEDKKIEKFKVIKDDMNKYETIQYKGIFYDVGCDINTFDAILADKINEIIDKINGE